MIVVTGAAGFIGSALVGELLRQGWQDIVAVDDFSRADKAPNLHGKQLTAKVDRADFFTWLDAEAIGALSQAMAERPGAREAQRVLAQEVTRLVHGEDELRRAERASAVLFGGSLREASLEDLLLVFDDVPSTRVEPSELLGMSVATALVRAGICASKGDAVRMVRQGGVSVNGVREADERRVLGADDLLGGVLVVLQKGARDRRLLRVTAG